MSPLSASMTSAFSSVTLTHVARDSVTSDFDSIKDAFSSWDSCMEEAYCKWPVIVAIIIGSLFILSLLFCIGRCLCCGLECCCGCFACCNACCPSPRSRRNKKDDEEAPQQSWTQTQPQPYQWQAPMQYGGANTAVFDARLPGAPTSGMTANADALPAMPSWQTAPSRHVEDDTGYQGVGEEEGAIAMGALGAGRGQQPLDEARVPMLAPQAHQASNPYGYGFNDRIVSPYQPQSLDRYAGGDLGGSVMQHQQTAYQDYGYSQQQQQSQSYGNQAYGDHSYRAGTAVPRSGVMSPAHPPSYHTRAPMSPISPSNYSPTSPQEYAHDPYTSSQGWGDPQIVRRPVNGSWREV